MFFVLFFFYYSRPCVRAAVVSNHTFQTGTRTSDHLISWTVRFRAGTRIVLVGIGRCVRRYYYYVRSRVLPGEAGRTSCGWLVHVTKRKVAYISPTKKKGQKNNYSTYVYSHMPYAVTKVNVSGTRTDYFKDGLQNKEEQNWNV